MRFELRFLRGSHAGQAFTLDENATVIIGRGADTTLRLNDPALSRRHCQITNGPQGPLCVDLNSANGTYVNGQRISAWTPVPPGAKIILGANEIEIALPVAAAPVAQPAPAQTAPRPRTGQFPVPAAPAYSQFAPQPAFPGQAYAPTAAYPAVQHPGAPPQPAGFPPAPQAFPPQAPQAYPAQAPNLAHSQASFGPQNNALAHSQAGIGGASQVMGGAMPPASAIFSGGFPGQPQVAPRCSNCNKELTPAEIQSGRFRQDTNGRLICANCLVHFEFDPHLVEGYTISKKLGAGAFGAVFKATQEATGRTVALKTIKPQLVSNEKDIQRFFREAQTGAKLVHPGIAQIYDAGSSKGTYFIAMEYIEGQELSKLIEQYGKLDVGYTLRVGIQMFNALQHAYEQGIVHRDIKPENVLVTGQGVTKIVDFGLAKNFQEAGKSGLTAPGEGMGTLAYMPPEQLDNALMADQRSDIYSGGATLYHCLSGRRPFNEKTTRQFILKILKEMPPSLRELNPLVPPEVQGVIEKAMAKKPEDRYQTGKDVENDLRAIFERLAAQHAAQQRRG